MPYLDLFKKKLTVFDDEMVIKRNDNVVRWKKWDGQMPRGNWWKANARPRDGKCGKMPHYCPAGMGTAGIDWCIIIKISRKFSRHKHSIYKQYETTLHAKLGLHFHALKNSWSISRSRR